MELNPNDDWQTRTRGKLEQEYDIFVSCADDGKGGDSTNGGRPLPSFDEWLMN